MSIKYIQTKSTALTYGISSSSTTIQLKNLLKLDGSSLSASDIGDLLYGTFAPGTSREEIFSIVGSNVTIESDGKVTITSVVRGLKEVSPYNAGGYSCDHPAGEVVVFGNNPQVYQWLKDYIDSIVIAGGVDASSTAKGVAKLSVDPAVPTEPIAVGNNDPRIPTTDYTAAMAGTQGLPNANNKYVTQDNVYTSETDQTQATQNGTVEFGEANSTTKKNIICQSFTPLKTKIKGVKLYKLANTGTFTGDVTVALFADSAGSPTGSALATVTITNAVYNALAVGEFSAEFSAEYSMTAGTLYWFKVSASTADSSNHPNLGTNTAGGYANGSVKYYNGTDGYVAIATIDLYFKTLQGTKNQAIQSNDSGYLPSTFLNETDLFSLPVFQQDVSIPTIASLPKQGSCNIDGSVVVMADASGGASEFSRYARDSVSGYYYRTHSVAITPAVGYSSFVVLGNYVYNFSDTGAGTSVICYRYDLATLANETLMTMPSYDTSGNNYYQFAWTDGTYLYLNNKKQGTTYYKLSVSGTTLTQVATGTCVNLTEEWNFSMFDGTNVYQGVSSNGATPGTIKKFNNLIGSSVTEIYDNYRPTISTDNSVPVIIPIDSTKFYIGRGEGIYNASAQMGASIKLYPVTKV